MLRSDTDEMNSLEDYNEMPNLNIKELENNFT